MVPPIIIWYIHGHRQKDERSARKRIVWYAIWFLVVNGGSYAVSYARGVKGFSFRDMTLSYRVKYFTVGCILALLISFVILVKDRVILGVKRLVEDVHRFAIDMRKYFKYSVRLAKADLKTEVANSYLDWLWWLIEPFCMMLIYSFVYGVVFRTSEQYFTAFIFIGLTAWSFFQRNVSSSVNMVRYSKDVISRIYIPKYILLFSKMLVNGFKTLISFGIVGIMMIAYRVDITINILYIVPILIDLFLVSFAVGVVFMHYGVFVRDLSYIIDIVLQMLMFMTGTFYSLSNRVPAPYGEILEKVNPVAYLIAAMRDVLLYGKGASWLMLLVWAGISIIVLMLGISKIYRNENSYVKVV